MNTPLTFEEHLAREMEDPEFRAEWEALEPEFQVARAIIEGKPLTGFPLELIAKAAGVSFEEARIIKKGKQVMRAGKQQAQTAAQ